MSAFDKVIGYRATKQELLQICDMLRDRTIYEEMGARMPHGLLLYGFSLLDVESRSSPPMSEGLNARSEAAVQLELEQCYCKAKSILTHNDIFLKAVAEALVAKKTLLYSDIQAIRSTTVKSDQPMISNTVSQYRGAERAEQLPEAESTEAIRQRLIQRLEERRKTQWS